MAYVKASTENPLGWRPWISRLSGLGQADYVPSATTPGGAAQSSVLGQYGTTYPPDFFSRARLGQFYRANRAAEWPGIGQWYNPTSATFGLPNWAWWGAAALGLLLLFGGPRRSLVGSWQRVRTEQRRRARIAELERQIERGRRSFP